MADAEIKGLTQTINNLTKFSKNLVDEIVAGCEAVQAKVVANAQARAPYIIGNLKLSIAPAGITIEPDNVTAAVAANANYAGFVEGVDEKWQPIQWKRKPPPKITPFLGPALLENMNTFVKAMAAAGKRAEESLK